MLDKKTLSERDICTKCITPALISSGWDIDKQILEEVSFTDGKIFVRGKLTARGKRKRADYILYYNTNPVAIIEAKDNNHSVNAGIQQALDYAQILDIPCVFSSNGDGFIFHDRTAEDNSIEKELSLDQFPSPDELWNKFKIFKNITSPEQERIISQEYFSDGSGRKPRYYQEIAINRAIEAIAKGQNRILLVMATGTGKTYTAFQIVYRLWKAKVKQRILYLADRNVLISQTKNNDFRYFGDKMTWVKHRQIDKSFEIYLALYQGLSGNDEEANVYKQFSLDFFDLVVIDECHRGSASEDSAWREILAYFKNATHIGMTATPKETNEISNIEYFGDPIYTYSLKQGIDDGFLAPYRVVRVGLNVDLEGWRPEKGKLDKAGNEIEDRMYNRKDFDRNIVIDERTDTVAKKVTEFLSGAGRFSKTIVFCVDIDHAERMRMALSKLNADLVKENYKYVMQITGDNKFSLLHKKTFFEFVFPTLKAEGNPLSGFGGADLVICKNIFIQFKIPEYLKTTGAKEFYAGNAADLFNAPFFRVRIKNELLDGKRNSGQYEMLQRAARNGKSAQYIFPVFDNVRETDGSNDSNYWFKNFFMEPADTSLNSYCLSVDFNDLLVPEFNLDNSNDHTMCTDYETGMIDGDVYIFSKAKYAKATKFISSFYYNGELLTWEEETEKNFEETLKELIEIFDLYDEKLETLYLLQNYLLINHNIYWIPVLKNKRLIKDQPNTK